MAEDRNAGARPAGGEAGIAALPFPADAGTAVAGVPHLALVGGTGSGKSFMLKSLLRDLWARGIGALVVSGTPQDEYAGLRSSTGGRNVALAGLAGPDSLGATPSVSTVRLEGLGDPRLAMALAGASAAARRAGSTVLVLDDVLLADEDAAAIARQVLQAGGVPLWVTAQGPEDLELLGNEGRVLSVMAFRHRAAGPASWASPEAMQALEVAAAGKPGRGEYFLGSPLLGFYVFTGGGPGTGNAGLIPSDEIPGAFSVDAFRINGAGAPGPVSDPRAIEEGLAALGDGCPLLGITRQMAGLAAAVPGVVSATVGDSIMGPGKVHQVLLEAAPGTDLRAVAEAMAPCRHALLVVEGRGPGRSDIRAWNYGPHKCECDWSNP